MHRAKAWRAAADVLDPRRPNMALQPTGWPPLRGGHPATERQRSAKHAGEPRRCPIALENASCTIGPIERLEPMEPRAAPAPR